MVYPNSAPQSERFIKAARIRSRSAHDFEFVQSTFIANAPTSPSGPLKIESNSCSELAYGLTDSDVGNLNAVLNYEVSRNTMTNYLVQWIKFVDWTMAKGVRALPAEPAQVAAYLAERIEKHGHKPATLRVASSANAFVHKAFGLDDPCASPNVKRTLRSATRKAGRSPKQAEALMAKVLSVIQKSACIPRSGRVGRAESQRTARRRGTLDIALNSLMRDAMLRVSEAAVLIWRDIGTETDGTGRLLIRRSKTDAEGGVAILFVSAPPMAALRSMRLREVGADKIFELRPNQISKRIKQAAQAAGLGAGFSGHSPRIGMARDLARVGDELTSLMNAGHWRSPSMPAYYTRNETAGKGAVALFHSYCRRRA